MRSHLSLAVLVGLLFCSLAAIEIPELVHLTDDTSNDYTVMVSQSKTSAVKRGQQSDAGAIAASGSGLSERNCAGRLFCGAVARSHDLLHLGCVQRT
jgi:hypothetical protein